MKQLIRALLVSTPLLLAAGCEKTEPAEQETAHQTATQTATQTAAQTAEIEIEVIREEAPDNALGPGTEAQQQLLVRAKSAFLNEQWDTAETHFKELVQTGEVSGPQVTAYIALGALYRDTDRVDEAHKLYEELLAKAPEVPEVHFVMARTLADQGETTRAIHAYERTLELQPEYLQAMVEVGGLYAKSGRAEESQVMLHGYERKIYALAKELESKETPPERKLAILEVLSFIDDDRANEAIAKNVLDPNPEVRERAIWLAVDLELGGIKPNLRVLAERDPSRRVQLAAREALRSLADVPEDPIAPTFVK